LFVGICRAEKHEMTGGFWYIHARFVLLLRFHDILHAHRQILEDDTPKEPVMRKYSKTHEWFEDLGDGRVRVGISHHAAHELSDIVFVELPDPGRKVAQGGGACVLESVKAVSDVYVPAGEVVAVNEALRDRPALVNEDPEGNGWLVELKLDDPSSLSAYLDPEDYQETLEKP
jgi:glycine cleavage system H protein